MPVEAEEGPGTACAVEDDRVAVEGIVLAVTYVLFGVIGRGAIVELAAEFDMLTVGRLTATF